MRTTTEGRKGVKDSVSMWLCVLLQVDGCQGQCACHDGGWGVGGAWGEGGQGQCRFVVMCATIEGWIGVKDSLSSTVSGVSL